MSVKDDLKEIKNYAHFWNWLPDWGMVEDIYSAFPNSFAVLTPFAYTYLEEMIRSTTSEYGIAVFDKNGKPIIRKVGQKLIELAVQENSDNHEYLALLEKVKDYYEKSQLENYGENRNCVAHGYTHPRFWSEESFEKLIHDIALISKYANF